jgi:hypothetical protein
MLLRVNGTGRDKVDPLTSSSFLYLVSRESACELLVRLACWFLTFIDN